MTIVTEKSEIRWSIVKSIAVDVINFKFDGLAIPRVFH